MEAVKNCLLDVTKRVLDKRVKTRALTYLYDFLSHVDDDYDDKDDESDIFHTLAKFMQLEFVVKTLQLFVDAKKIRVDKGTWKHCEFLANLVTDCNKPQGKSKTNPAQPSVTIDQLDLNRDVGKNANFQHHVELDTDDDIYKVCFHCYLKKDKLLFVCPECGLVYFCSQQCNAANIKLKSSIHPCTELFYDNKKRMYDQCLYNHTKFLETSKLKLQEELIKEKIIRQGNYVLSQASLRKLLEALQNDSAAILFSR